MDQRYTLKSADGVMLEVGNAVISRCGLLRFVTEDCAESMKAEKKPTIPIPRVKSETLRIIIDLAEIVGSHPECCEAFLSKVDVAILIRIIHAADYLICLDILDMASKVANMRISEDSRMDLLCKHGSPSRVGHFASILGGMKYVFRDGGQHGETIRHVLEDPATACIREPIRLKPSQVLAFP